MDSPEHPHVDSSHTQMKLLQGQIWKKEEEYLRIVRLDRLQVEYKSSPGPSTKKGVFHLTTKKQFCRLLKGATLVPLTEKPAVEPNTAPET